LELTKSASRNKPRFSEEMIQECLHIIESGDIEDQFEIIPRIGVLRDPRFHNPLLSLLLETDAKRAEFAAYAMGALGDQSFLEPLKRVFLESQQLKGFGVEELQIAVVEAIGSIGDDAAVDFFLPMLKSSDAGKCPVKIRKWIVESLGSIAQQGGGRSLEALIELTSHSDSELRAQAISEVSVAYWHRPNEMPDSTLQQLYDLTTDPDPAVSDSALAALQSLADVGCRRAEEFFLAHEEE
jgi:HEAT repeat protein